MSSSTSRTHKFFLLANYVLIGTATSCAFLALSLRLLPSLTGLLLILLHFLTIALSVSSCSTITSSTSARWHAAHMAATVLVAIFQGAVALLVFSRTDSFLERMRSYVQEEDGVLILRMVGVLGLVTFVLEWVVLALAFVMRFYVRVDGDVNAAAAAARVANLGDGKAEERKDWLPFQVV